MSVPGAEGIRADVMALFSPSRPPCRPGRVGIELELIAVADDGAGKVQPVPIVPSGGAEASLSGFLSASGEATQRLAAEWDEVGTPRYRTCRGGLIQFEPGGQIEYSTEPRPAASQAIGDVEAILGWLQDEAPAKGLELLGRGLSPVRDARQVGLLLRTPRYAAMDRYFDAMGTGGRRMMRLTASMQVNLDFGDPAQARRRWAVANQLAPVNMAMFANSPVRIGGETFVSGRALAWEGVDPTRTGVAWQPGREILEAPWTAYTAFALTANAMLRIDPEGRVVEATAGLPFNEWWVGMAGPRPTVEEWRMHLTTLFPEVRPRGWLEIRSIDAPSREWWSVPPTLLAAIMYDDRALSEAMEALQGVGSRIGSALRAAPRLGIRDPLLGTAATDVMDIALRAAPRFPDGYFDDVGIAACEAFRDRFVTAGRMQADDGPPAPQAA